MYFLFSFFYMYGIVSNIGEFMKYIKNLYPILPFLLLFFLFYYYSSIFIVICNSLGIPNNIYTLLIGDISLMVIFFLILKKQLINMDYLNLQQL